MTHFWVPYGAIDGDGSLNTGAVDAIISIDTPGAHSGQSNHAPPTYYGLGVVGWQASGAHYPPYSLRWLLSTLDGRPAAAQGIYWQLGAGITGYLTLGFNLVDEIQPYAMLTRTTDQNLPDSAVTPLSWSAVNQNGGYFWPGASNSILNIQYPGIYEIDLNINITTGAYTIFYLELWKNGANYKTPYTTFPSAGGTAAAAINLSIKELLLAGDTLEFRLAQVSGAAKTLITGSALSISRVTAL